jgi:prepilin-type N-terminal cleavage/methylation domain-containing protein
MQKVSLTTKSNNIRQSGMSLVEVLLAVAVFAVFTVGVIGAIIYGQESTAVAGARERAVKIAEEGIEAVRNIRDSGYDNLPVDGTYGLVVSGGIWTFSGVSDITDIFTRTVTLSTIDPRTRNAIINVTWSQTIQRPGSVSLNTNLTDWVTPLYRNGMLVYGDGNLTTDAIKYKIYNDNKGTWSAAVATADVDGATTNKSLRAARVYSSSTRNEKILVSRHYNGTTQWIYAQVYNGSTNTWGNVVQLATWTASTFLDVQNFDATYMANGNLMVVYSDNTSTPKSRIWDGTTWSGQSSLTDLAGGDIPTYIITKARPATNEIMMAAFAQTSDTDTQYYSGSAWSAVISHATAAPVATNRLVDFDWSSQDTTRGSLVYATAATGNGSRQITSKIWIANGSGSGAWSAAGVSGTQGGGTTRIVTVKEIGLLGANEFQTCSQNNITQIICYKTDFTPTFTNPTNQTLTATTDAGIQRSYDLGAELSGTKAINIYSDSTTTAKLKKYDRATAIWDVAATSVNPSVVGIIKTARVIPNPLISDMMILVADANLDMFSIVWDGTNHLLYTTPAGKSWTAHGINGSATTDYWYDFVWDGISS